MKIFPQFVSLRSDGFVYLTLSYLKHMLFLMSRTNIYVIKENVANLIRLNIYMFERKLDGKNHLF